MQYLPQQDVYSEEPRDEVARFVPTTARSALEVGCGRGGFGLTLRRILGPDARIVGVEAVEVQAATARLDHGFDAVIDGYFPEALARRAEKYDLVVFNDVLEHVLDPWTMLKDVHEHLNPGGKVVATVPSIQYGPVLVRLLKGRWDYTDMGTLDRTHVRFFTRATMVEMFKQAGYLIEQCEGVNSALGREWSRASLKHRLWARALPDSVWLQFVVVGASQLA